MANRLQPDPRHLPLPANYTVRPVKEEDVQSIIDLIYDCDASEVSEADRYTADDIVGDWEQLDRATDSWCILSPEGTLAAYALFFPHDVSSYGRLWCDGYVHPTHKGHGLGGTLLHLMEARAAEVIATQPEDVRQVLVNNIVASSASSRALFEAHGYTLVRVYFTMRIDFDELPKPAIWPEGMSVRTCDGSPEDIRRAYEIIEEGFRDHFAQTPRTFEDWQSSMVRSDFEPSLWFLAMHGSEVVGASLCRAADPLVGPGSLVQLAVLAPWRKHGLGSALLHHTFGAFYQRGIKRVSLGVDGQSLTGAQRLYEAVGMHVTMRIGRYEKELRSGRELHPGRIN